jgi:hypothetical protein
VYDHGKPSGNFFHAKLTFQEDLLFDKLKIDLLKQPLLYEKMVSIREAILIFNTPRLNLDKL